MGKGDSRSRKGKIFKASYGNTRPHAKRKTKAQKARGTTGSGTKAPATKAPAKKK